MVTFESAFGFLKVNSKAISPDANMIIKIRETRRASDSTLLIVREMDKNLEMNRV